MKLSNKTYFRSLFTLSTLASLSLTLLGCSSFYDTRVSIANPKVEHNIPANRLAMNMAKELPESKIKPNILWILTDDQRADSVAVVNQALRGTEESELGYVESPNLDALAAEGVLFPLAYNQSPGCSPSRYSMATGQYPHRSGRYGFEYSHRQNDTAKPTIPEVLRANGYQTMLTGKAGLRIRKAPTGGETPLIYDHEVERYALERAGIGDWGKVSTYNWQVSNKPITTSEVFYYPDGRVDSFEYVTNGKDNQVPNPFDSKLDIIRSYTRSAKRLIMAGESPMPENKTLDAKILEAFQNYLNNANQTYTSILGDKIQGPKDDKPVMISLSFHFPHTPVLPPKPYQDRFEKIDYKLPEFSKDELNKLPKQLTNLYRKMKVDEMSDAEKLRMIQDYYAFTAYGDSLIGKAIKDFKAYNDKVERPYLIIATIGDHGWHLGEQGISAKFAPWNKSGHGAMIIVDSSGDYFPKNTIHNEFVEYVDIAPTIYAAAGIDVETQAPHIDGFDLAQIIRKPELKRDYVLGEMNQIIGDRAYLRTARFGFSMKVRPFNGKPGETHEAGENILWAINVSDKDVELALYDMQCDPNERNNVGYDTKYKEIVTALRTKAQNIFLGDNRLEVNWKKDNISHVSNFAEGAHNRKLEFDELILPNCDKS
ncbi:MAG: sulfatase-like hydrolase/transferase [Gammaproteobacteria bacterium]|nr:sulfatase-like hydrolase/transferase [Gammaproteobacteria bacterium]